MRRSSRAAAATLAAALLLTACGEGPTPPAASGAQDATEDATEDAPDASDADAGETADDTAEVNDTEAGAAESSTADGDTGADEPDIVAFDPNATIPLKDWEHTTFAGEVLTPFVNLGVPDELAWPATVRFIQTAVDTSESDEVVTSSNGAFDVPDPDADVDLVQGFFEDRLPADGWQIDEVRDNGDESRWTQFSIRQPHENPERSYELELRIEYLSPAHPLMESSERGTLRWWLATSEVFEAYEG